MNHSGRFFSIFVILVLYCYTGYCQEGIRCIEELKNDWLFRKTADPKGSQCSLDESTWEKVRIPHDWAIAGPFNKENDVQENRVIEDGETKISRKYGKTGSLPFMGIGWYRKHLYFGKNEKDKHISIEFDGAMSHAMVYLNGRLVGEWPYGYSSFSFNLTPYILWGKDNVLAVRLENKPSSSRWYPGAGLYRAVRLVKTNPLHVRHWGTYIQTKVNSSSRATVSVETTITSGHAPNKGSLFLKTIIYSNANKLVTETVSKIKYRDTAVLQVLTIPNPRLWSAEHPELYHAVSTLLVNEKVVDHYKTVFGIRNIQFSTDSGMIVNGTRVPLKGVCLHSDLGPLGMAFNRSAWQYRLQLLKGMGCNAIRGSHNPQDPALLDLFDEMGFYFIDEAFDEWKAPKNKNGYALLFDQWAKKDLQAMIKRDRNHPSVIMYSIGNEVREQSNPKGAGIAAYLTAICHQTDSTRPVTAAFNNWKAAISNGLADAVDIPGWNYKPDYYSEIHEAHPHWMVYGSETVSTVSSRGAYEQPAIMATMKTRADHQSSSYDLEYCSWSQLPDMEWKCQEENPFVAGEFVWTGFDYLGEPTPYGSEWTSRSSYFGIIDLCGIPKDRYYLYQSHWSKNKVLHLLPHWNWEGKEGTVVPVYVYTNYPAAEIFINGKSYGRKSFEPDSLLDSYRLRWNNTLYKPGTLKVIAYDSLGLPADSQIVHTAGKADKILLQTNQSDIKANGEDIIFVTVSVADKNGNICPMADNLIKFEVSGAASIKAVGNGNPGNMRSFASRQVNAFNGKCMLMLQCHEKEGSIHIKAVSSGLNDATLELKAFSHRYNNLP